jgi:DNA-binding CsgD family transcriptional regulator/PAS domain-containing protein
MLSVNQQQTLNSMIHQIYHSVMAPGEWEALLQNLADYFRAHLAANVEHLINDKKANIDCYIGYSSKDHFDYANYYGERSVMYQDFKKASEPSLFVEKHSPNFDKVRQSETYNDFHLKLKGANGLTFLKSNDNKSVSYTVLRRDNTQNNFSNEEIQIAQLLLPHLVQASKMAHQFELKQKLSNTFEAAFDKLQMPVFLIHPDRNVVYINQSAESFLSASNALTISNNRLKGVETEPHAQLSKLVASVFSKIEHSKPNPLTSCRMQQTTVNQLQFFELSAMPLVQEVQGMDVEQQLILLTITNAIDDNTIHTKLIVDLYKLTQKEAQVVQAICKGLVTNEIAAEFGISQNAVRFHTKNIFQKLHISRQSELVKLILNGPIGQLRLNDNDENII